MRRRIDVLLSASLGLAVLLTPAGFTVQAWLAPVAESRFAYEHPGRGHGRGGAAAVAGRRHRRALVPPAPAAAGRLCPGCVDGPRGARDGDHHPRSGRAARVAGHGVGRQQMRTPPARAADASLAAGDCRPLAIAGFGPVVPVVSELAEPQRERFWSLGLRLVFGTSDLVWSGAEERHRARAYRYAERYNRHLLARLRTPGVRRRGPVRVAAAAPGAHAGAARPAGGARLARVRLVPPGRAGGRLLARGASGGGVRDADPGARGLRANERERTSRRSTPALCIVAC